MSVPSERKEDEGPVGLQPTANSQVELHFLKVSSYHLLKKITHMETSSRAVLYNCDDVQR